MTYHDYKNELSNQANYMKEAELLEFINNNIIENSMKKISIIKASFSVLKDSHPKIAYEIIKDNIDDIKDEKFLIIFQKRLKNYLDNKIISDKEFKQVNKKVILNLIVEKFLNQLLKNEDNALEELDRQFEKYYYLKNTAIKRILRRIPSNASAFKIIKEKYS